MPKKLNARTRLLRVRSIWTGFWRGWCSHPPLSIATFQQQHPLRVFLFAWLIACSSFIKLNIPSRSCKPVDINNWPLCTDGRVPAGSLFCPALAGCAVGGRFTTVGWNVLLMIPLSSRSLPRNSLWVLYRHARCWRSKRSLYSGCCWCCCWVPDYLSCVQAS